MTPEMWIAIIGAGTSLVIATVTPFIIYFVQRKVEGKKTDEKFARLDSFLDILEKIEERGLSSDSVNSILEMESFGNDFKEVKEVFEKITILKREIYAKEEDIKKASFILAELAITSQALSRIMGDYELIIDIQKWVDHHSKKLMTIFNWSEDERDFALRYSELVLEMFELNEKGQKEEAKKRMDNISKMLKDEASDAQ